MVLCVNCVSIYTHVNAILNIICFLRYLAQQYQVLPTTYVILSVCLGIIRFAGSKKSNMVSSLVVYGFLIPHHCRRQSSFLLLNFYNSLSKGYLQSFVLFFDRAIVAFSSLLMLIVVDP